MNRTYTAKAVSCDGRDIIFFEFTSEHRANSKPNKQDARTQYKRKHGHAPQILLTWRTED